MLRFHNTLTRRKDPFKPIDPDRVTLYTCGPTVYDFAHIGNFRTYIFQDLLRRYLQFKGFTLFHVMNVTDVEDKIIQRSLQAGIKIEEYTTPYTRAFFEDSKALNLQEADLYPKATEHIPQMVEMIQCLEQRGHTYTRNGSIYFDISTFPDYGKLSGVEIQSHAERQRVDADVYEKEHPRDFALWKAPKPEEPSWETAIGPGRPGWHIECSAMSSHYLGPHFDLHTGGVDLIFPHHENEIAQSEACYGEPFVNHWLHAEHLMVDNEKMSKSLGNFYTVRDLFQKGANPAALRYLLLSIHYRKPLNFTLQGLEQAQASVDRLTDFSRRLSTDSFSEGCNDELKKTIDQARDRFETELDDDLNISGALGAMFHAVREANTAADRNLLPAENREHLMALFRDADRVLSIIDMSNVEREKIVDDEINQMILQRDEARRDGDYRAADRIRDELRKQGILLEDTPQGTRWKRVGAVSQ